MANPRLGAVVARCHLLPLLASFVPCRRLGDATVLQNFSWLFLVAMIAGCANAGVRNSADFATSLNELTKREVLFNLRKAYDEPATFVPSHVVVSQGKSTTSGSVSPSFTIPLGPGYSNTIVPSGNNQFTGVTTFGAGAFTIGGNATASQDWTMTPATDSDALMRLRALYLYVAGLMDSDDAFLCSYPVQRQPVKGLDEARKGDNIAYWLNCPGRPESILFYADPNFVTYPNCIVCITSAGSAARKHGVKDAAKPATAEADIFAPGDVRVRINDRLQAGIVFGVRNNGHVMGSGRSERNKGDRDLTRDLTAAASAQDIIPELPLPQFSLQRSTQVYLKAGAEKFFADFILLTSAAMAPATTKKKSE